MSSKNSDRRSTRARILEAALIALETGQHGLLQMGAVAELAGVSRQAVYLHFRNRADLALAVARYADAKYGLEEAVRPLLAAATAEDLLTAYAHFLGDFNPRIHRVVRMGDTLRRTDPDMEAAWQDRLENRRRNSREMAARIDAWGRLAPGLAVADAGDWLAAIGSVALWEELVVDFGWSTERYVEMIVRSSKGAVLAPSPVAGEALGAGHGPERSDEG